nr:uncharacterized protein CTRU02_04211 [Colletotrichum truncatum]KAF6796250.1 hypothetical protein CTRU02_04211 [Colletotrichum truncatum]
MVILTWNSRLEESLFELLGLDMFSKDDASVIKWDLQLAHQLDLRFPSSGNPRDGRDVGRVAEALGIPIEITPNDHNPTSTRLTHNAGMDACFTLEILLALCFLTPAQIHQTFSNRSPLPQLPSRFSSWNKSLNDPKALLAPKPFKPFDTPTTGVNTTWQTVSPIEKKPHKSTEPSQAATFQLSLPINQQAMAELVPASWRTDIPGQINIPSEIITRWAMIGLYADYGYHAQPSPTATLHQEPGSIDDRYALPSLGTSQAPQALIPMPQNPNAPSPIKPKMSVPAKRKSSAPAEPRTLRPFVSSSTTDAIQSDEEMEDLITFE